MAPRSDSTREAILDETLELLHFGFRAVIADPDATLLRRGFGRVHHRVLFFVRKNPGVSVGELLGILAVSKQALHRPLSELVADRLIERAADPANRRVARLRLTRAGAAFERALSARQRDHFARAFATVGPAAERGFRAVLAALPATRA